MNDFQHLLMLKLWAPADAVRIDKGRFQILFDEFVLGEIQFEGDTVAWMQVGISPAEYFSREEQEVFSLCELLEIFALQIHRVYLIKLGRLAA